MKKWLTFWGALVAVQSLQAQTQKNFTVAGVCGIEDIEKAYCTYHNGNKTVQDSVLVNNGKYNFKGRLSEPIVATIALKKKNWVMPLPSDRIPVLLMPGAIVEVISKEAIPVNHHQIKTSSHQALLDTLVKWEKGYSFKEGTASIAAELAGRKGDSIRHLNLRNYYDSLHNERSNAVYGRFLELYPQSPVALHALQQLVDQNMDPDRAQQLWYNLPEASQKSPSGIRLKKEIALARKTAVGAYALNFTQSDTVGRSVSLTAFKGKWVLIDFWASWCGPCRRENPNVMRAYENFKSRNFTVLGVSLDEPQKRAAWIKAVQDDHLKGTQVMDVQNDYNYAARLYRIEYIPQNVLVDPQGRIAAKNLKGAALHAWLEKLLPPADVTQPL